MRIAMRGSVAGLLLGMAATGFPAWAQERDFSKVQIKSTPVAGKIHMLEGAGGNIGVSVGSDGILIVDDQFAPMADKIRAALKTLGGGKLAFVLNTHWHGDHTGGNADFGREGTIIAHDNVRKRLATEQSVFGQKHPASPKEALPVITFNESLSVHFNGEEIQVLHYPGGHTDGDSVIYFSGSNVAHLGDDFFAGTFPFVDIASGGNVVKLAENIAQILERLPDDVKIIPGHGPLSTKKELRAYHGMLVETTAHVRKQVDAGKSLEAIQAAGLPEKWKEWGNGFINTKNWIGLIHSSLTKTPYTPESGH